MRAVRGVLLVLVAAVTVIGAAPASAALSWRWGPKVIPTNLSAGAGFVSVSCPSTSMCVAADDVGHVVGTTSPLLSVGGWPSVYRDPSAYLNGSSHQGSVTGIACPSISLCVAVDANGFVLVSTHPTASGTWKRYAIDPTFFGQLGEGQLDAVSCSSAQCVAFDYADYRLWVTSDPVAGNWTAVQLPQRDVSTDPFTVDNEPEFTAASCGAVSSCVAFNSSGDELTSSNPADPAAWHTLPRPDLVLGHDPDTEAAIMPTTLRCPAATMCVAAGIHTSGVATTTNPNGGRAAWQVKRLYPGSDVSGNPNDGPLEPSIACGGPSLCIAYDNRPLSQQAVIWTLTGYKGRPAWSATTTIPIRGDDSGSDLLRNGACPASSECLFIDNRGYVYLGTPGLPVHCVVPKLTNKTVAGARRALARSHCTLGKVTRHRNGRVRSQHPKAGSRHPAGTAVSIVVG